MECLRGINAMYFARHLGPGQLARHQLRVLRAIFHEHHAQRMGCHGYCGG